MRIEILRYPSDEDWARCLLLARMTQGKDSGKVPTDEWKKKILAAEHSPVRTLMYTIVMHDIPYYCSVHIVRHKYGVEHLYNPSGSTLNAARNVRTRLSPTPWT